MSQLNIGEIIIVLVLTVVLFILMRNFYNWYFRISERVELQMETNRLLKLLLEKNNTRHNVDSQSILEASNGVTDLNNPEDFEKVISAFSQKTENPSK